MLFLLPAAGTIETTAIKIVYPGESICPEMLDYLSLRELKQITYENYRLQNLDFGYPNLNQKKENPNFKIHSDVS